MNHNLASIKVIRAVHMEAAEAALDEMATTNMRIPNWDARSKHKQKTTICIPKCVCECECLRVYACVLYLYIYICNLYFYIII